MAEDHHGDTESAITVVVGTRNNDPARSQAHEVHELMITHKLYKSCLKPFAGQVVTDGDNVSLHAIFLSVDGTGWFEGRGEGALSGVEAMAISSARNLRQPAGRYFFGDWNSAA